ncbi:hypothetical protein TorRG33x02_185760 [Trema orientale]|uniref:Uncharacterized protein n=1 Tax=Trema orientale TaxID=63057 RepID=A0A2P5EJ66_TREOI|nr:hypothetical protein TorRG33x02_185760 [Trema orientale]
MRRRLRRRGTRCGDFTVRQRCCAVMQACARLGVWRGWWTGRAAQAESGGGARDWSAGRLVVWACSLGRERQRCAARLVDWACGAGRVVQRSRGSLRRGATG